jgi:hypothetical protein
MTESPVDLRKIATEISQRAIDRIIGAGEKVLKDYWARFRNRDVSTYADYLVRKSVQADSVRNFIYDTRSASLYDIYVPTMVSDTHSTGDQLIQQLCSPVTDPNKRPSRALAIVGNAGAGKSLFMKHAFFKIQKIESNRIPVFIEVRSFNRLPLDTIETRISDDFVVTGTSITREQVTNGLRSGLFVILLDGMDELKGVVQAHYDAELVNLLMKFPLCPVLVSSRPTERIRSGSLDVRSIAPLSLSRAKDLIGRLDFAGPVKEAFTNLLDRSLFDTHYEFVSVPLLCTIMFLTFSDSGRISNDRHEFFEDAFLALWSKHDSRKGNFERDRYTGLQKNEFLRLLSAFSISSYAVADYDFRPAQFNRHFAAAARLTGITCREEDFEKDLITSTSLVIQDGPYIRFCHRSFQEYFSAIFLSEAGDSIVGDLIEELSDRIETDYVLDLLLSLNADKIERNWVIPKIRLISKFIDATKGDLHRFASVSAGAFAEKIDISSAMDKVRSLYKFDPATDKLRAAYDAFRHMDVSLVGLRKRPSSVGDLLFSQDKRNFLQMSDHLDKKYEHRASALKELLGNPREDGSAS